MTYSTVGKRDSAPIWLSKRKYVSWLQKSEEYWLYRNFYIGTCTDLHNIEIKRLPRPRPTSRRPPTRPPRFPAATALPFGNSYIPNNTYPKISAVTVAATVGAVWPQCCVNMYQFLCKNFYRVNIVHFSEIKKHINPMEARWEHCHVFLLLEVSLIRQVSKNRPILMLRKSVPVPT